VFDDVERRRFLVEPTREDPPPALIPSLRIDLHERAGQRLGFPRRSRLAGTQPHHYIADTDCLTRLHRQIAFDAITLVEQSDHGDAIGHRCLGLAQRVRCGSGLGDRLGRRHIARSVRAVAERQRWLLIVLLQRLHPLPSSNAAEQQDRDTGG
jgi:hypothetical protein